jgi:HrpA-like RNA helicase
MVNALERLYALEALDAEGKLTEPLGSWQRRFPFSSDPHSQLLSSGPLLRSRLQRFHFLYAGLRMAEFPLPPMQARMLLASGEYGCSEEICIITAMLQVQNIFMEPMNKKQDAMRRKYVWGDRADGLCIGCSWRTHCVSIPHPFLTPAPAQTLKTHVYLRGRRPPYATERLRRV